jgi:hypothetical protein
VTRAAATLDFAASTPGTAFRLRWWVCAAALALATVAALVAAYRPVAVGVTAVAAGVVLAVAWRPAVAAYTYVGVAPLVVGVERGVLVPFARPQEVILALLWIGLVLGPVRAHVLHPGRRLPRLSAVDVTVGAMAVTGSLTTMLWMYARGTPVSADDLLFALTLWKYLAVYLLFRVSVRTDVHARRVLAIVLGASSVVAVLGILQVLDLFGVPELLTSYAPVDEGGLRDGRASATIGTSIGFADAVVIALAVAIGWAGIVRTHRVLVSCVGGLLALAALASGQASGVVALTVGAMTAGWAVGRLRMVMAGLPLVGIAALAFGGQVLGQRLDQLDPRTGLPISWTGDYGRLANLRTYIWPHLLDSWNLVWGVRPSSRVAAAEPWRDWVWIESGYTWLLWNGGLLLLVAFVIYLVLGLRTTVSVLRVPAAPGFACAAVGALSGLVVVAVLMLLDPHLTIRGSADLLFPLVALSVTARLATTGRSRARTP